MNPQHKKLRALLISYVDAHDEIFESSTPSNYWLRSVADSYTDPGQLEALERGNESSVENLLSSITEVKINGELFVEKHPTTKEHWWEALYEIYEKNTESTVRAYSVLFQPERPVDDRLLEFEEVILPKLNQIGSGNHKISSNWSQSKFHGITTLLLELFYPDSYVSYKYLRTHRFFDQYFDFSVQNAGQCDIPEQYAKLTEGYEIMNEELSEIYPEANMHDIHAIIYNYGSLKRKGVDKGDVDQSLWEEDSQKHYSNSNRASDLPVSVPQFQQLKVEIKQEIQNSDWGESFFWESPDLGSPYIGPSRGNKDDFIWLGIAHEKMAKLERPTRGLQFEFGINTGNKAGFFDRDVICGIYINRRTGEKQLKREISKRLYNHANKFAEKIKNSPYLIYFGNKSFSNPSAEQIKRHAEQVSEGLLITRNVSSEDIRKKSDVSKFVISEFLELVPYYGLLADIKELPRLPVIDSTESPKLNNTSTESTDPTIRSIASSSSVFEVDSIKRKIDKLLSRGATHKEARSCVAQYVCDRERDEGLYSIPGIGLTVGYELSRRGITSRDQLTSGHLEIIKQIDGISDHHLQPLVEAVEHIENPDNKKEVRRPLDAETNPPKQDDERDISIKKGNKNVSNSDQFKNRKTDFKSGSKDDPIESRTQNINFTSNLGTKFLHIGPVNYASSNITSKRRWEFQRAFDSAVEVAVNRGVDSVVLTGQLFATQSPTKKNVTALRESLNELRDAEIPLLLAGSPRDYEFDLVDDLIEEDLMKMLSASPVLIGDVAVYGASPVEEGDLMADVASMEPIPTDAESAVLAVPGTVSPPVEDADVMVSELLSASPVPLEAILAGDRRHRESHIPTDVSGCQVFQAGPVEYLLRKWVTKQPPEYPCSIRSIRSSSTEQVSIPHRPFVMYRVESPSIDEFPSLKNVIEAEGRTVLVQLTGPQGSEPLSKQMLQEWLREQTEVSKVWDDRSEVTSDQPLVVELPMSEPPVELSKQPPTESVAKPSEEKVPGSGSGSSMKEGGVSGSLGQVCNEEVEEGSAPEPNEITESYVAFWSLRTVVENVLADDSTPVSGDSDHPMSQYRAMLNKFTWGSSLVKEIIPGYGTLQKEVVPFPHREYREAFGNGDWVTDFQCIDTVLFREDTQERLEEHNIVHDASQYVRPVTPESGEPLPEAPMTESELQNALDLLSEFRIVPECPWEVTDLDLDEQPRTATYPMGRLYDAYREEVTRRKASGSKAVEAGSSSTLPAWLESTPAAESSPSNDEEVESFLMQHGKLTHLYREITPPEDVAVTEPLSIFALNEYHPLTQTESPPEDSFRLYSFAKQEERTHMNHFVERLRDLIYRRVLTATATFDLMTVYPGHEAGSISEVLADLARETVKETHIIYADLLERTRTMPRQKTLSRNKRWQIAENPSDHLAAVNRLDGRSVILLDDVCTSGASLSAGAHVLRAAGADRVLGVTLGSTHGSREDSIIELSNRARTVSDLEGPQ